MARTDWQYDETVNENDMNEIGNEINNNTTEITAIDTITTPQTTDSMITIPNEIKKAPIALHVEGRTVSNSVLNGNFKLGTAGWVGNVATISTSNGILTATGNGAGVTVGAITESSQAVINAVPDKKIFVRGTITPKNVGASFVTMFIVGTNGGSMETFGYISNPEVNKKYTLYDIFTLIPSVTGNIRVLLTTVYPDSATANGKVMEVQEVMAIDLDLHPEFDGMTAEEINEAIPHYIDGTQSADGVSVRSVGKNLFNKNAGIVRGSYLNTFGSIIANSDYWYDSKYIPVNPNTQYTRSNTFNLCLYDIRKNFIGYRAAGYPLTFTTPSDCYFVRATELLTVLDTFQLIEGAELGTYEPYKETTCHIDEFLGSLPNGVKNTLDGNMFTKMIEKVVLDGNRNWAIDSTNTGIKVVKSTGFINAGTSNRLVVYDGRIGGSHLPTGAPYRAVTASNELYLVLPNTDTGWGDSYTPTVGEIQAYFLGWRMCQLGFDRQTPYTTGTKAWFKITRSNDTQTLAGTTDIVTITPSTLAGTDLLGNTYTPYQLHYQLATPIIKELNLPTLVAGKHIITEGWKRYELKAEDITTATYITHASLISIYNAAFKNAEIPIRGAKVTGFIERQPLVVSPDSVGTWYSGTVALVCVMPLGITLAEARKLLEGTVIYYKLASQFHVTPSWNVEIASTLLAQVNDNSNTMGDLRKVVLENIDLLKSQGTRLDNVGQIVESGSNANGSFVRFVDGLQICEAKLDLVYDQVYRLLRNWSYPATFISVPNIIVTKENYGETHISDKKHLRSTTAYRLASTTVTAIYLLDSEAGYVAGDTKSVCVFAIGRWK